MLCFQTRGDKTSGRWTHHPTTETRSGKRGVNVRQGETRPSGSKNHPTKGTKKGNKTLHKKGN
jgi:hypothetical protein